MTAQEAIQELLKIQQYCTPRSLAAVDYAIRAIQKKEGGKKEEKKGAHRPTKKAGTITK